MPNFELKNLAKRQMEGKYGLLIGAFLLEMLIVMSATAFASFLIPGTDMVSNILFYIVSFLIQLLAGVLQVGVCLLYLHAACNMPCQLSDLFYGFTHMPDKIIKAKFFLALLSNLCMLPSDIMFWQFNFSTASYEELMQVNLITMACTILYSLVTLAFTPLFYMMLDFPQLTVSELYRKSIDVMKGHKIRFLLLELSFIPIMLLTIPTCGIALFWIIPFMNMTFTNFYLDLMARKNHEMGSR